MLRAHKAFLNCEKLATAAHDNQIAAQNSFQRIENRKPRTVRKLSFAGRLALLFAYIALLSFTSSGCTTGMRRWVAQGFKVGPEYCPPGAETAAHWRDAGQPTIKTDEPELTDWWTVLNDPVLDNLIHEAKRENIPLRVAALRVLEARAQLGFVRGHIWPQQQQLQGRYSRNQMSGNAFPFSEFSMMPGFRFNYDDWSLGAQLAWELDFWGRFRRMIEMAEANLQAEQEACRAAAVLLVAETASTYLQLRTAEERLQFAKTNVELQKKTVQIVQARVDQGVATMLDLHQAQAILASTESMIPMLETLHRVSENRLCTLMAMPPQDLRAILGGPAQIPETPPEIAVGIPADLLRRRPDVRRAERLAAAQCAKIGVAESELYPHIAITGQLGYQAENLPDLFTSKSFAGSIGPGFRWDVLNYGRLRNAVLMENVRFRQAVLGYQEAVLRAAEEAEGAITAYLNEQVRVRKLAAATDSIAKAVQLAMLQYEQGLIDFQRVIDSQTGLVRQQDALAEARGKAAANLVQIFKALGGGWQTAWQLNPRDAASIEGVEKLAPAKPTPSEGEPLEPPSAPQRLDGATPPPQGPVPPNPPPPGELPTHPQPEPNPAQSQGVSHSPQTFAAPMMTYSAGSQTYPHVPDRAPVRPAVPEPALR